MEFYLHHIYMHTSQLRYRNYKNHLHTSTSQTSRETQSIILRIFIPPDSCAYNHAVTVKDRHTPSLRHVAYSNARLQQTHTETSIPKDTLKKKDTHTHTHTTYVNNISQSSYKNSIIINAARTVIVVRDSSRIMF